jgi:hypothetical protein
LNFHPIIRGIFSLKSARYSQILQTDEWEVQMHQESRVTSMTRYEVEISMGGDTEAAINFVFENLTDAECDEIDLTRTTESGGVAREPITSVALLSLAGGLALKIIPLIDRFLEHRRQRDHLELVMRAAENNSPALEALVKLAEKYADVTVKFVPIKTPGKN